VVDGPAGFEGDERLRPYFSASSLSGEPVRLGGSGSQSSGAIASSLRGEDRRAGEERTALASARMSVLLRPLGVVASEGDREGEGESRST
jgi:hypothetical protein